MVEQDVLLAIVVYIDGIDDASLHIVGNNIVGHVKLELALIGIEVAGPSIIVALAGDEDIEPTVVVEIGHSHTAGADITLGFGIEMFNRQFGVTPKEFEQQMTKLRRTTNSQEA